MYECIHTHTHIHIYIVTNLPTILSYVNTSRIDPRDASLHKLFISDPEYPAVFLTTKSKSSPLRSLSKLLSKLLHIDNRASSSSQLVTVVTECVMHFLKLKIKKMLFSIYRLILCYSRTATL